jgi:hypothetical protein
MLKPKKPFSVAASRLPSSGQDRQSYSDLATVAKAAIFPSFVNRGARLHTHGSWPVRARDRGYAVEKRHKRYWHEHEARMPMRMLAQVRFVLRHTCCD